MPILDEVAELPVSLGEAEVGDTVYVSVYIRNLDDSGHGNGGGYCTLFYDTSLMQGGGYTAGKLFRSLTDYTEDIGGEIDLFGGITTQLGKFFATTLYTLVGTYEFTTTAEGTAVFTNYGAIIEGETLPQMNFARQLENTALANDRIRWGSASLAVGTSEKEIENVSVFGYTGNYDGAGHSITVSDPDAATDTILYTYNGTTSEELPYFTNAGTYEVAVTIQRAGYLDWSGTATVSIAPRQLEVSGTKVANKPYDGTTSATVTVGKVSGIVAGDNVAGDGHAAFPSADQGTYTLTVSYTLSGADAGNYTAPAAGKATATISAPKLDAPVVFYAQIAGTTCNVSYTLVNHADQYIVYYSTDPDFTSSKYKVSTNGEAVIANLDPTQTHYVRIQARDSSREYKSSDYSATVEVDRAKQLEAPSITLVSMGAGTGYVKFGAVANADRYTVECSASSDFAECETIETSRTSAMFTGLKLGQTYYFRVQANDTTGTYENSDFSATVSGKVTKLAAPEIISAVGSGTAATVTASAVEGASMYVFHYSTDPEFGTYRYVASSTPEAAISGLASNTEYYVRVQARKAEAGHGNSAFSETTVISSSEILSTPIITLASASTTSITMETSLVEGANLYVFFISTDPNFGSHMTRTSTTPYVAITNLESNTVYHARAQVFDTTTGYQTSVFSETLEIEPLSAYLADSVFALDATNELDLDFGTVF